MESLREKVAVVTGGASGIGLALSRAFLGEGIEWLSPTSRRPR